MEPDKLKLIARILFVAGGMFIGGGITQIYMTHAGNMALNQRWNEHKAICPLLKPPTPGFSEGARFAQIALQNQPGITTHDQLFNVASNWWFEIDICKGTNIMRILAAQAALAQQQTLAIQRAGKATNVTQVGVMTTNDPVVESNNPAIPKSNSPIPAKKVYKEYKEEKYKEEKKVKAEVDGK